MLYLNDDDVEDDDEQLYLIFLLVSLLAHQVSSSVLNTVAHLFHLRFL